jgi:hypothetical protein
MWADESSFTLLPTSERVYVWRTPKEAYQQECLVLRVKHGGNYVRVWAAISWYSVGPIITPRGQITAGENVNRLGNQVNTMIQMLFPNNDAVFQDDNVLVHTAVTVHSLFEGHKGEFQYLSWPAQSPDLNIIEPLWSVFESRVRNMFPPPTSQWRSWLRHYVTSRKVGGLSPDD